MKTRLLLAAVLTTLSAPRFSAAEPEAEFIPLDSPDAAEVRALGERAINRLAYSMVSEASNAVARKGETAALEVCHLKDVRATGAVIADMPRIVAWKRTSLRVRDPANAPDAADLLALNRVQADLTAGNAPPRILVQRVARAGGAPEWRVYKPVAVLSQCLSCHGPAENIVAETRAEIARRYPDDKAMEYSVGQWRGLIRVTVGPPPAAPATKTAPGKS